MNPLRELRNRLGFSRAELATKLGKSEATIEKYEAEIPVELARSLAKLAAEADYRDLRDMFNVLSGDQMPATRKLDLRNLDPDERELAELTVSMYRKPTNELEQTAVQLLRNIRNLREKRGILNSTSKRN